MHERDHCHDEAANHQLPASVAFWIFQILSTEEYSSLVQNLMQIHCSPHECNSHTVHMLIQQYLPPPLTRTVKSSLFTHAPSSHLFLAARLHWYHANHSCYINNGWAFSRQNLYVCNETVKCTCNIYYKRVNVKSQKVLYLLRSSCFDFMGMET